VSHEDAQDTGHRRRRGQGRALGILQVYNRAWRQSGEARKGSANAGETILGIWAVEVGLSMARGKGRVWRTEEGREVNHEADKSRVGKFVNGLVAGGRWQRGYCGDAWN
jgi:hypothetical protein